MLSLSPAVVEAKGSYGEGISEEMTINNMTPITRGFALVAQDVTTKNGSRVYVPAGHLPGSIAATAVFSPNQVTVKPYATASARVTFTIPDGTTVRAVRAIFKAQTIAATKGSVGLLGSLASLFVFTLSNNAALSASPLNIQSQSTTRNERFSQILTNTGSEPLMPPGVAVVLSAEGRLVGKTPIQAQRLLPGERLTFQAEYPTVLNPGQYRVLVSFQYAGKTLTTSQAFTVR